MKKTILYTFILLVLITGCSNVEKKEKPNSKVIISNKCMFNDADISVEWTFTSKDGIYINKSLQKTTINKNRLDELGVNVVKQEIDNFQKEYNEKGIDYNAELTNNAMVEILSVDYAVAEMNKLKSLGFVTPDTDGNVYVPKLKKTIEIFKAQGYKCSVEM